ncbi:hypothetical protein [Micromonospora sp. NPDC047738]|uniref:hypothetical protein n=1 Tax=unclassified Micromonospora TaxID=2617518 RepID=UPI0033D34D29
MSAAEITRFLTALHRIHDRLGAAMEDVHQVRTTGEGGEMSPCFDIEDTDAGVHVGSRYVLRSVASLGDQWDFDARDDVSEMTVSAAVLIGSAHCEASVTVTATMRDPALSPYPLGHHVLHEARRVCADGGAAIDALTALVDDLASPVTFLQRLGLVVQR